MKQGESAHTPNEVSTERFQIKGLQANVEILIDRWGVPHIYAGTLHDVFLAQGWNAARDRLWQMDYWRRSGLGELAEALGPEYVAQDRAARLFIYRGNMDREWAAYGPDAKAHAEAFVAGVNAYIAAARSDATLLPVEFKLAGYAPAYWQPEDLVRVRNHAVGRSAARQLLHAQLASTSGFRPEIELPVKLAPPWTPIVPEGLDLRSIPANVLDAYELARRPPWLANRNASTGVTQASQFPQEPLALGRASQGSNNWVIAASKTTTGRPILANDPHRSLDIPSLRYLVHLVAPGLNVIGASQPPLPGIEIGHNEHIAFGLTIFSIAQEDLCVYETHPEDPDKYRYADRWEQVRVVRETIAVRGGPDIEVDLRFTRHGPIVFEEPAKQRAYAVRAAWLDTGGAPYFGALSYLQAKDREEFATALKSWGGPGENHVCADTSGQIGWFAAGLTPIRRNSDGLLPVPGDGRYEWDGYLPHDALPSQRDPADGYIATANQMNLPPDFPYAERRIGFTWPDEARFNRINAVLGSLDKISIEDCKALQNDYVTVPGQQLMRALREISVADDELREIVQWLLEWDGRADADSARAALYEVWWARHLVTAVIDHVAPGTPPAACLIVGPTVVADLMTRPDSRLGANPRQARDAIMLRTLSAAVAETKKLLGPDRSKWRWGQLATVTFEHPFAQLADEQLRRKMNVGPMPCSGDTTSVSLAYYRNEDFRVQLGASVRLIMDVGEWDRSLAANTPGQSGDPSSPHYRDLAPGWLSGTYFPLAYSRAAVERVTERRILLQPDTSG